MSIRPFTAFVPRQEASKIDIRPLTGKNVGLRED
jgi:hypothetical protein